ncbi:hypothetical protein WA026_021706 [Henosepilachna vigintioctopunctata]|uniref:Uncharacterized protein n=1 Tax=Henosepilachna vigintioctopunctata TaxID=420089 RepID=A0AAW1UBC3_9CUCU
MELKYIVLTIIKILVSVPTILLTTNLDAEAAALMGGYLVNNDTDGFVGIPFDNDENYRRHESSESYSSALNSSQPTSEDDNSEEIPNPSPLVIPGYNLPENIFNKGKPFYMEKDPLTGQVDFANKTPTGIDDDFYEYIDDGIDQSDDIYNKANIDRKDGSIGSHRPSDINQLTPNFHDFLNLPIKYNSNKYVYPLISSSYANTKVQGNVNKYHNHKTFVTKYPTFKPSNGPYLTSSSQYFQDYEETTSTTTPKHISTTTKIPIKKPISYPSFNEDFSQDYEYDSYEKNTKNKYNYGNKDIYYTTEKINNIYLTTSSTPMTTTKKAMSLLEQLFGSYDEIPTTTEKVIVPSSIYNVPSNENKNKEKEKKVDKITTSTSTSISTTSTHTNVATGSNMEMENIYEEYDDDYYNNQNISEYYTTNKPQSTTLSTTSTTTSTTTPTVPFVSNNIFNSHSYKEPTTTEKILSTKQRPEITTETYFTLRETSLPLGDNHVSNPKVTIMPNNDHIASSSSNYRPIIIATQDLRNQLNNEKVVPKPFSVSTQHVPSTSSIHISPDQDTVSFVVGHHQSMDGSSYNEPNSHNVFNNNYFQPEDDIIYNNSPDTVIFQQPQLKKPQEVTGSVVTIQTQTNSEASLSIGVPVEHIKKVPGQVMDAKLEFDNVNSDLPTNSAKVVFPNEKDVSLTSLTPPPSTANPPILSSNREILKLASKPMYHQLPSDLTPPKEELGKFPLRLDSPRPPWDPRPGHFFSGNFEYSRPPRPLPDIAYKRIDTLPNILPQFRPNMKSRGPHNSGPHDYKHTMAHTVHRNPAHFYDNRLHREPLLERPSNRPIEFYEKLQPPPLPPKNFNNYRKIPPPSQFLDQRSPIVAQDRKGEDYHKKPMVENKVILEPPKIITNLKKTDGEVETLQMLQAKQSDKKNYILNQ